MKALWLDAEFKPRPGYKLTERERTTQRALNGNQVYYNPVLRITDIPVPKPGPDDILVQVKACGVCGSDVHFYEKDADGYIVYPYHCKLPCAIGHEWSGVVVEAGANVKSLRVGDRVCVEEMLWCAVCDPCRIGMPNQCANLEEIGFTVDGAFAEYVVTKPQYCWKLDALLEAYGDEEKALELGAMVEPCSVVYNGMFIRAGGFKPGGHVAVFGAGPIGLAAIGQARAAGAAKVISFETIAERRALAAKMGADHIYDPVALAKEGVDAAELILDLTRGEGIAMGVEAAGVSRVTVPIMERALAIDGCIAQIGMGGGQTPVTMTRLQARAAHIHGAVGHSGHGIFPSVIRLMAAKRLDMLPVVTGRYPLDQAIEAIVETAERRGGKALVKP